MRLQTPRAAAVELASTSTPNDAKPDCDTHPYIAATTRTIPKLNTLVLECSNNTLLRVAVENVLNEYEADEMLVFVNFSTSYKMTDKLTMMLYSRLTFK